MTGKGKGGGEDVSSDRGMLQSSHDPSTARPDPSATLRGGVQTTHAENASGGSAQDDRQGGRRVERARSRQESGQSYRAPTLSRKSGPPPRQEPGETPGGPYRERR